MTDELRERLVAFEKLKKKWAPERRRLYEVAGELIACYYLYKSYENDKSAAILANDDERLEEAIYKAEGQAVNFCVKLGVYAYNVNAFEGRYSNTVIGSDIDAAARTLIDMWAHMESLGVSSMPKGVSKQELVGELLEVYEVGRNQLAKNGVTPPMEAE